MRALPQSLVNRAELLARSHDLQDVADILGVLPSQITRMKKRGWKEAISGRPVRRCPPDFIYYSNRMTHGQLAAHYKAGNTTITRWMAETPNARRSMKADALRIDAATGKRIYQIKQAAKEAAGTGNL